MPVLAGVPRARTATRSRSSASTTSTRCPARPSTQAGERGATYPQLADPGGELLGDSPPSPTSARASLHRVRRRRRRSWPRADRRLRLPRRARRARRRRPRHRPRGRRVTSVPTWLRARGRRRPRRSPCTTSPASRCPRTPTRGARRCSCSSARASTAPTLVLTERAHHMRSHPGQVSFPGGSLDPGEDAVTAALREAQEETGLDPAGVEVFAILPDLWLPPSNFAVTPVLGWWREPEPGLGALARRGARRLPGAAQRAARPRAPDHRGRARRAGARPASSSATTTTSSCWGFTGGIVSRLFEYLGWIEDLPDAPEHDIPDYMLGGRPRLNEDVAAQHRVRGTPTMEQSPPMNVLDWVLVVLVLAYALSGYWQGFVTGAFATTGLLLGGLFGVWLAPVALGNASPSLLVSLGALFIVILAASLGQGLLPVRRRAAARQDHLAAGAGPRRGRRRRAVRGRRAARGVGAGRGDLRLGDRRRSPPPCAARRCSARSTRCCRSRPAGCCRPSTTWSARRSSRATSSPSPPSRSAAVPAGDERLLPDPDVTRAASSILKIRGANDCGRGRRGLRLPLRQRPRRTGAG